MIRSLLDRTMDFTVAPGYTRAGIAARRSTFTPLPRMEGRTVLVTGATAGLGRAAAQQCATLGARVVMLARDAGRGRRAVDDIVAASRNPDVELVLGDLADLTSVRTAAAEIADRIGVLHVLVNNAGVMSPARQRSADGFELTFATNVLGPFLLTEQLRPLLIASAPARILTVTSGGMFAQRLDLDDLQSERREYDGTRVYARTKRAEMVLTGEWARQLDGTGVVAHAMHPGWVDTPGVQASLPTFAKVLGPLLRTPDEGADTITWLAAGAEAARCTGRLWHDRVARAEHRVPMTRERDGDARRLYGVCAELAQTP